MNENELNQLEQAQALDLTAEIKQFVKSKFIRESDGDYHAVVTKLEIFNALIEAVNVVCGDDEDYAMTVDFLMSDGDGEISSYVIAIRAEHTCPLPIYMALHHLLAIMSEYRSSTSQDQGANG
ncbi:MAG: hypothetical protein KME35_08030 [Aphanocapsa sp. GSE-SYN-MK-11-07L]|jgi:hypothetical protein|nr:hypothetical protein [Aphanocapsa sp. GSE-SYN-MK-11-07L]